MKKPLNVDIEFDEPKPKKGAYDYSEEMSEAKPKASKPWHGSSYKVPKK